MGRSRGPGSAADSGRPSLLEGDPPVAAARASLEAARIEAGILERRIFQQSDEIKLAEAQWQKARAQAERVRAERIPDPTLGLYTASEIGGRDRIVGVTVSIPLPGGLRTRRADKAVHSVKAARQEVEQRKRQLEAEIAAAAATAEGSFLGVHIAEAGSTAMQESAQLTPRAYSLGEATSRRCSPHAGSPRWPQRARWPRAWPP